MIDKTLIFLNQFLSTRLNELINSNFLIKVPFLFLTSSVSTFPLQKYFKGKNFFFLKKIFLNIIYFFNFWRKNCPSFFFFNFVNNFNKNSKNFNFFVCNMGRQTFASFAKLTRSSSSTYKKNNQNLMQSSTNFFFIKFLFNNLLFNNFFFLSIKFNSLTPLFTNLTNFTLLKYQNKFVFKKNIFTRLL